MSGGLYFYESVVVAQLNRPRKATAQQQQQQPHKSQQTINKILTTAARLTKKLWH